MSKIRKTVYFNKKEWAYIEAIQEKENCANMSAAVNKVITEHMEKEDVKMTEQLINAVAEKTVSQLQEPLEHMQRKLNFIDKENEVSQLLLNCLLAYSGMNSFAVKETQQLQEARKSVNDKIKRGYQKKRKHDSFYATDTETAPGE